MAAKLDPVEADQQAIFAGEAAERRCRGRGAIVRPIRLNESRPGFWAAYRADGSVDGSAKNRKRLVLSMYIFCHYCIPSVAPATGGNGSSGPTGGTAFSIRRFTRSSAR
jgi:hypothetical protein